RSRSFHLARLVLEFLGAALLRLFVLKLLGRLPLPIAPLLMLRSAIIAPASTSALLLLRLAHVDLRRMRMMRQRGGELLDHHEPVSIVVEIQLHLIETQCLVGSDEDPLVVFLFDRRKLLALAVLKV